MYSVCSFSSFSIFANERNPFSLSFKIMIWWWVWKLLMSIYLMRFLLRSSSLSCLSFSRCSILTISLFETWKIFSSFNGLYCKPYRY